MSIEPPRIDPNILLIGLSTGVMLVLSTITGLVLRDSPKIVLTRDDWVCTKVWEKTENRGEICVQWTRR